jgi:HipA-like protein
MSINTVLNVWYQKSLVGQLWQDPNGKIGFRYEQNWTQEGFAISQQLPLENIEYPSESGKAHLF